MRGITAGLAGLALLATVSCRTLNCRVYPESPEPKYNPETTVGWDTVEFSFKRDNANYILPPRYEEVPDVTEPGDSIWLESYKIGNKYIMEWSGLRVGEIEYISPKGYIEVFFNDPVLYKVFTKKELDKLVKDVYKKK